MNNFERGTCIFAELKNAAFSKFKGSYVSSRYKKRQVVFFEGHTPHGVYLVCSGSVKVFKTDLKGHQLTIRIAHQGDILGYQALFAHEPYSITAETLVDSTLAFINEAKFKEVLGKNSNISFKMFTHLSRDVRIAEDKARDMAMKSSRERLADLLISLKEEYGTVSKDGTLLKMPYTRVDLAELAGLAQETVIRLFAELKEQGTIAVRGRSVTIMNEKALVRQAAPLT